MALSDKNIVITPNISSSTDDPKIVFTGANTASAYAITLRAYPTNAGTLSFEGGAGQLFSISNTMSGTIYSVNDVSGIPSIEVLDTGLIKFAQYSGNVAIGQATANYKLDVAGNANTGPLTATSFSGAGALLTSLNASNLTSGIVPTAQLGSGTASSSTYLRGDQTWQTISAGATITDDTSTNATRYVMLGSATSGSYTVAYTSSSKLSFNPSTGTLSATIFNSLSDENQKENIKKIDNATDIINQINGYEFNWKDNGEKSSGVIAQQLEQILPHLVTESEGTKSVNYAGIIGYLIEGMKDQQNQIDELKSIINTNK